MLLVEIIKAVLLLIHQRAVPIYSLDRYLNHLEDTTQLRSGNRTLNTGANW